MCTSWNYYSLQHIHENGDHLLGPSQQMALPVSALALLSPPPCRQPHSSICHRVPATASIHPCLSPLVLFSNFKWHWSNVKKHLLKSIQNALSPSACNLLNPRRQSNERAKSPSDKRARPNLDTRSIIGKWRAYQRIYCAVCNGGHINTQWV